ncbi:MAG: transglutaminase domain-containing protein [Candidatus Daviesbacteria bacterium]|nr:MAG: transglutaminase domain-containing protein [Candidatus Daviesbacteria bacterium]
MLKKFFVAIFLTLTVLIVPKAFAAEEFATTYDVTYDVGTDGVTTVTEKINLKNLTTQYYASEFKLTIGATKITDIAASDPSGPLKTTANQSGTNTTIAVKFNQQVAGLGKELPWTLSFKSTDFAQKQGKVWEVSVPKVTSTSNLKSYNLTLSVPVEFGDPTAITPTPKSQTLVGGKRFLTFDKSQLENSGVLANFGSFQLFDFDLTYNLENKNLVPVVTNIALPPDTAYQDVIFTRMEPQPLNVTVDSDGNYLAWYRLSRSQQLQVKIIGSTKLYIRSKVKNPKLDSSLKSKYLLADKYWEVDNPAIKLKLTEILGESPATNLEKARAVHRWVASYLKYDPSRLSSNIIERLGAVTALNNPNSAVCMEYTDLFIALSRAAGVPAREINGFAYTSNPALRPLSLSKDILHAWPEFWDDSRGWVMIDPTWESTTGGVDYFSQFDLNHFAFAVKGLSSQSPAAAGSYKYDGVESHDVKVTLSEIDFIAKPNLSVDIQAGNPILAGFPGQIKVIISNNGNGLKQSSPFSVFANNLNILEATNQNLGPIPAFGSAEFIYNVRTKSLFDNYADTVTVNITGQKYNKEVLVKPFLQSQFAPIAVFVLVGAILIIYLVILSRYIYKRRALPLQESLPASTKKVGKNNLK